MPDGALAFLTGFDFVCFGVVIKSSSSSSKGAGADMPTIPVGFHTCYEKEIIAIALALEGYLIADWLQ